MIIDLKVVAVLLFSLLTTNVSARARMDNNCMACDSSPSNCCISLLWPRIGSIIFSVSMHFNFLILISFSKSAIFIAQLDNHVHGMGQHPKYLIVSFVRCRLGEEAVYLLSIGIQRPIFAFPPRCCYHR